MILSCFRCQGSSSPAAKFQDEKYGSGRRVHNETDKSNPTVYRCTICGTERSAK